MSLFTRSLHTSTCLTRPLTFTATTTEQSWWFSIIYTTTTTTNETSLYHTLPNTTAIRPIHPSIHPSRSSKQQATSQTLFRLQATMTTTTIATPPRPQTYSINQSINPSLQQTKSNPPPRQITTTRRRRRRKTIRTRGKNNFLQ